MQSFHGGRTGSQDRLKDKRHVLFESVAHLPAPSINFVQDTGCDQKAPVCLRRQDVAKDVLPPVFDDRKLSKPGNVVLDDV